MSNDKSQNAVPNITSMPTDDSTTPVAEKRPNPIVRGYRKIRQTPPKTALAIGLGVGLVTVGAVLGRKTAPLHLEIVESDFELEPVLVTPDSDNPDDTNAA